MCNLECRYFKCQTGEHAGKYAFMCGNQAVASGVSIVYILYFSSLTCLSLFKLCQKTCWRHPPLTIMNMIVHTQYFIFETFTKYLLQCYQSLELHLLGLSLIIHHLQTSLPLEVWYNFLDLVTLGPKVGFSLYYPFFIHNKFFSPLSFKLQYTFFCPIHRQGTYHTCWLVIFSVYYMYIYLLAFVVYSVQPIQILSTLPRSAEGVTGLCLQIMDTSFPQAHLRQFATRDYTCSYQRYCWNCWCSNSEVLGHVGVVLWMWFYRPQFEDEGSRVWLDC